MEQWLAASPDNALYFHQLKQVWESSRQLAANSAADENQAWQRFQQHIHPAASKAVVKRFPVFKIAAAIAIMIMLGWGLQQWIGSGKPVQQMSVASDNTVKVDSLPDGSVVTLNKHSGISYPSRFTGKDRPVKLKGEAFFNVAHDKTKPFLIEVNDVEIMVLGTSFNIRSNEKGRTEVVVETGRVQVKHAGKTIELTANESILIEQADTALQKTVQHDKLYNYYRTRTFVCNNTPLWKLAQVLSEAYDVEIVITDEQVRKYEIDTVFDNEPLEHVLNLIGETFHLKWSQSGNQILINR